MLTHKIKKKISRLADNYYTRIILKNLKPVNFKDSEYFFIFHQVKSKFNGKLYLLLSHQLSGMGIASCFKFKNDLVSAYFPRFDINGEQISNSFISKKRFIIEPSNPAKSHFEWNVDIGKDRIEAEGINFFPLIRNTLRTIQRRYNVVFEGDENQPVCKELILSCDMVLKYFLLLKSYAKKSQKKIRLVGFEADYVPNGVLRMLCERAPENGDIEFIELRRGYMSYFGQHHQRASYVYCSNLTNSKVELGLSVSKEELSAFNVEGLELDRLINPVSNALKKDMDYVPSDRQRETIKIIEDYKGRGKKVFVLFPHVFYDTPVDDKSEAFNDMCEWIMETIKYFGDKDDLLLIKPHPAEFIKDQPKKTPTETLASFLADVELPKNTIILKRDLFSIKDLSPFMSCGLVWRSSVGMELAFLGVPCIIAGNPPYRALDLNYAQSREHYFHMIDHADTLQVTDQQKVEVAKYLYLLEKMHVHVDCIEYDQDLSNFYWQRKALKSYLKHGNKEIESIAKYLLT